MEIHRADSAYRRRTLLTLAAVVLLCGVLLWLLDAWLREVTARLIDSDPDTLRQWLRWLLAGLGLAMALPALALGLGLRRLALHSKEQGRFPPREWKTLRDVRVLRDSAAASWARRTERIGAAMFAIAGLLLGWAAWAWWNYG